MRRFQCVAAAALLTLPGVAQAAEPPCLTSGEFTALSTYALPSVIRGTTQRCAPALPSDSFLRQDGEKLAARYAASKDQAWPAAKAAFLKLGTAKDARASEIFKSMSDDALRPLVDGLVTGVVVQQLPVNRCSTVDRLFMLLSPLPAENTAGLIGLAAGLGARGGKARVGDFSLCDA
jgi:hypothetical protein